jgi:mono/diheme cytochrome c family protein
VRRVVWLAVWLSLAACGATQHRAEPSDEVPPSALPDAGMDAATVDAAEPEDASQVLEAPAVDADAATPPVLDTDAGTSDDPARALEIARGRRVYERVCETCHEDGPRITGRHLSEARVRHQVREGGSRMRAIPVGRLGEADLAAVCAFLGGR